MPTLIGLSWCAKLSDMNQSMDVIARYFDQEYEDYDEDLPVLEAFAQRTGGPLLELGCGTGRLLVPLAAAGYDVTGVDVSDEMIARARQRAERKKVLDRVELIRDDFASVSLERKYGLIFVVMNTFLHLTTTKAQLEALAAWRSLLRPHGLLIIDVLFPDVAELAQLDGRLELERSWTDPETGSIVQKYLSRTVDLSQQRLDVTLIYDTVSAGGALRRAIAPYTLRYVWRAEMELLLQSAGLEIEAIYGDWQMAPHDGRSDKMIIVARLARGAEPKS